MANETLSPKDKTEKQIHNPIREMTRKAWPYEAKEQLRSSWCQTLRIF
jgi:hypothetical protein